MPSSKYEIEDIQGSLTVSPVLKLLSVSLPNFRSRRQIWRVTGENLVNLSCTIANCRRHCQLWDPVA